MTDSIHRIEEAGGHVARGHLLATADVEAQRIFAEQVLNQFRCDKNLREDCVAIYAALGMDLNTAFRMFMERSRMVGGLPFPAVLTRMC